jgi:sodium/pantothenate symporter
MQGAELILLAAGSNAALITFLLYTLAVFGIAAFSNQMLKGKSFLSEYFLGSRGLGVWAFALTFAATSASGGSFTGFPSKIYSHGWVLALWIGAYVVVPICTMGLLGKRINQVARISGSITVPDVLRDRFESARLGLMAVMLIVFFMVFNLVAQFKAGAMILKTLLSDVEIFHQAAESFHTVMEPWSFLGTDAEYLICLLAFGIAVIVYTTYGGFHAVVWTDVMQGIVMVVGVLIMLPLAIMMVNDLASQDDSNDASGMAYVTQEMAKLVPPLPSEAQLQVGSPSDTGRLITTGTWIAIEGDHGTSRLFRTGNDAEIVAGQQVTAATTPIKMIELVNASDIKQVLENPDSYTVVRDLQLIGLTQTPYKYGGSPEHKGTYVTGPGPSPDSDIGFLPLSLAFSFFFMWAISGAGQPSSHVRLMAFKNTDTLKKAIFTVAIYYTLIYFPLVMIFCCSRLLMPGMEMESDRIMPAMAVFLTKGVGMGWLAGLLVAAPFAAVMSTVDSFLLMISSAVVRDVYQRNINPHASEAKVKKMTYAVTIIVGTAAMLGAVNPPQFLQDIIVYTGSGLAACFLAPTVFMLYWPRSNKQGCMIGMLCGFTAHFSMYFLGMFTNDSFFKPHRLMDMDPIIVGLFVSFLATYVGCLISPAPPQHLVKKYFYKRKKLQRT